MSHSSRMRLRMLATDWMNTGFSSTSVVAPRPASYVIWSTRTSATEAGFSGASQAL